MNIFLWCLQYFVALVFIYSGISKTVFSEKKLVSMGMTGVEGLPTLVIRFIGVTEILGSVGLILPMLLNILPILTIISAICFAIIMVPAAVIHFKRKEGKSVCFNILLLTLCIVIIWGRTTSV